MTNLNDLNLKACIYLYCPCKCSVLQFSSIFTLCVFTDISLLIYLLYCIKNVTCMTYYIYII
jgi:hypothetical protein